MNDEKWISCLLVASCNYLINKKKKSLCLQRMLFDRSSGSRSHYWRQLEVMYMKNITRGVLSEAVGFSLTPPMIVSVSAEWMHASWMCNAAQTQLVNRTRGYFTVLSILLTRKKLDDKVSVWNYNVFASYWLFSPLRSLSLQCAPGSLSTQQISSVKVFKMG